MNRAVIAIIFVLIIAVIAVGVFFIFQSSSPQNQKINNSSSSSIPDDISGQSEHMVTHSDMIGDTESSHHYLKYSPDSMEFAKGSKRLLFFYANWCPTCRPVDAEIQENSDKIPEELTIIRVNYNDTDTDDEEKELARKYNVTYQHTFVLIDENGNEITKWNGGGLDDILARTSQ